MSRLARALELAVTQGFEAQAYKHGTALHRVAVAARARDPKVVFYLDLFDKQTRERGEIAVAAQKDGDLLTARRYAESAMRAATNAQRIREAVTS